MNVKIGIEVHVQLATQTKLFCQCENTIPEGPNTLTCETCLGMPGSKPSINKEAIQQAIRVALALNCTIANETLFSRKSYFYPDLPKNFQISQYELPLATRGLFENIRIKRLHLEEDPGSLIHKDNYTLIDYNRSGIPLIEIVTEPDFISAEQVRAFLNKLLTTLAYLNIYTRTSEASMRTDCNISIPGGERIEIKNIMGLKDAEKAINYEIERQKKELPKQQETRGWDSEKQLTYPIRIKETEEDYGYITEPDLTKIEISKDEIKKLKESLPEFAPEKAARFIKQFKISKADADVLTAELILANLFEKVAMEISPDLAARWIRREIPRILHYNKKTIHDLKIEEKHLIELLDLFERKQITDVTAKRILEKLIEKPFSPLKYVKEESLESVSEEKIIENYCKQAIEENPLAVEDYKEGKKEAFNYLLGAVMRLSKGKADPGLVNKILKKLLK